LFIDPSELNPTRYDAIIAGSGPAGAVVAKQMAAHGRNVLVLESGGLFFEPLAQEKYSFVHGQGHFSTGYWPNHWIRALGGTSAVWQGWVTPLSARNLKTWPIDYSELASWYGVAAEELGRNPMIGSWSARAVPGFSMLPFSVGDPNRYGEEAGRPVWDSENVHVLINTTLSKLHPRSDRRGIERLTLFTETLGERDIDLSEGQNVVLASGGMGNAQILLASDDGQGAAVGNEFDQVGRYLMEHPHIYNCATVVLRTGFSLAQPPAEFGAFSPALVPDDATHAELGPLDACFELYEADPDEGDAIAHFVAERLGGQVSFLNINARTEMGADPQNRVERAHGMDPAGLPRLRATCVFDADDYRAVLGYLQRLGKSLADHDIGRIQIRNAPLFFEVTGGGHIMGTTRMGADPSSSVADSDCRVHGYRNLFVAGSSVFTTGGCANPTLTIVALAARLGDYLGRQT
jgi:choline dehydrogenase-like flavoprotein